MDFWDSVSEISEYLLPRNKNYFKVAQHCKMGRDCDLFTVGDLTDLGDNELVSRIRVRRFV